jgi:hypothetical protein
MLVPVLARSVLFFHRCDFPPRAALHRNGVGLLGLRPFDGLNISPSNGIGLTP